ncbi:amino acid deaminase/aldolase [Streptacidiphilus jiangxiensis]|uniref:D-serine deaminase, pyridoxal phosphate-dependent n=1 Tax=Streptacidiphilus jiangxiensis TaxID=235985 RepID=A0A1H7F532_STRJI|nr:amino acid deaminase/aldolase [Streptacidiphilus jiangxiensis]SEK19402.1 D-serine deaminase, pyridoxal phosphate-dependent [Streptacidiphilus jiangxiensis]
MTTETEIVKNHTPASFAQLEQATAELRPPFAVVDLGALRANAERMAARAGGKPIRLASKSLRCRTLIEDVLRTPGYHGIMAFTLPEALWLARTTDESLGDILVAYPCADVASLRELAADERAAARIAVMADSVEHLDLIAAAAQAASADGPQVRVCLDLDASLRLLGGRIHLGMRRSPMHDPAAAGALARAVLDRPRLRLVGVMSYEGQIAGLADNQPGSPLMRAGVRLMQRLSTQELRIRRAAAVRAVQEVAPLEFVNGGGTGSLESTSSESAVTELGAGSGIYAPRLFDHYRAFDPLPAAYFALTVVRRPAPRHVTVLGGGWIASGPAGADRLPTPVWPQGLGLVGTEGAGEVQTPLVGEAADRLRLGDRVWFRHAKAGELCERVDRLHLVEGDRIVGEAPTYRGEGHAFL